MTIEYKLKVLAKIAKVLNENQITWAVGASVLLYFKGLVSSFNDIDILVNETDAVSTKNLLSELGEMQQRKETADYRTTHFHEFVIDKVEVDVMAGLRIVNQDTEHYLPLKTEHIEENITVLSQQVYLHSLQEWKKYYTLMGRKDKVNKIENHINL